MWETLKEDIQVVFDRDPHAHIIDLDHHRLPDPVARAIGSLAEYVQKLENRVNELNTRNPKLIYANSYHDTRL